jgi:alkanesulfonate monooxygenase SsuD/methylene tetrahydromethanopterin reductase-like flavin-dependent oxidoreductase (luciferase family)
MATTSDDGFALCARHGWGVMLPQAVPLERVASWVTAYKAACADAGRSFDPAQLILARGLYIGSDDRQAWDAAGMAYRDFLIRAQQVAAAPGGEAAPLSFDLAGIRDSAIICGSAAAIEKLRAIHALGIGHVIFFGNMGGLAHEHVVTSLRRFAASVMPAFRGHSRGSAKSAQ